MVLLPDKFLQPQRSSLHVGAEILDMLSGGPLDLGQIGRRLNATPERFISYGHAARTVSMLFALGLVGNDGELVSPAVNADAGVIE